MFTSKLKTATAVLLAVGFLAGACVVTCQALAGKPAAQQQAAVPPQPPAAAPGQGDEAAGPPTKEEGVTFRGRVLDPDGQPVADATLAQTLAWGYPRRPAPSPAVATTGADGRFEFTAPKGKFDGQKTVVVATAANYGVAWVEVPPGGKTDDLTLRLVKDVPVTGQIIDLEGKPVAGATLRVLQINAAPQEDLGPWLEAVQARKAESPQLVYQYLTRRLMSQEVPGLSEKVTTDAEGHFRITGIGGNRLLAAQLDGPNIASEQLRILTRPGEKMTVLEVEARPEFGTPRVDTTYYGSAFQHAAGASRPVVGVVRDRDTNKPLAGVSIRSYKLAGSPAHGVDFIATTTDAQGRYRLAGMPKGDGNKIVLVPADDQPYVAVHAEVPDPPGLDPVTVDFMIKRGVWIEGKITDKATGKPLQAHVECFALLDNPNLRDHPGYDGTLHFNAVTAKEDGSYRIVGLPGPGLLTLWRSQDYLLATERDDAEGVRNEPPNTAPYHWGGTSSNAVARVDPAKDAERLTRDVVLDPGETFRGTLVGPDGEPLTGVRAHGLTGDGGWEKAPLQTAEFTVRAYNPRRPRAVLFQHAEKRLAGVLEPQKEIGKPVTVKMRPGATVTGRLVDADGQPRANLPLYLSIRLTAGSLEAFYSPDKLQTDGEGRFRIEALLPGYQYHLYDRRGILEFGDGLRPGETKDLGNVQLKPAGE